MSNNMRKQTPEAPLKHIYAKLNKQTTTHYKLYWFQIIELLHQIRV